MCLYIWAYTGRPWWYILYIRAYKGLATGGIFEIHGLTPCSPPNPPIEQNLKRSICIRVKPTMNYDCQT
jgi:hypothetical protein